MKTRFVLKDTHVGDNKRLRVAFLWDPPQSVWDMFNNIDTGELNIQGIEEDVQAIGFSQRVYTIKSRDGDNLLLNYYTTLPGKESKYEDATIN